MSTVFGREDLIKDIVVEVKKGKNLVLSGAAGVGKSVVLKAALKRFERRQSEWGQFNPLSTDQPPVPPVHERRTRVDQILIYIHEQQAKAQFVQIAKSLVEKGILKPSALQLPEKFDEIPVRDLKWADLRRTVNRLNIRDLTSAIIPAIYNYSGRVIIAIDDMTNLTPTQQAFWLAMFDHAQIITCASSRKDGLKKLWWKMKVVEIPPLSSEAATAMVRDYIAKHGMMIESPDLYVSHIVKQAGGNPQAIMDMLSESAKERLVNKRQIREMRHAAGVAYLDFSPVLLLAGASIVATRYLAMGVGDTALYILAGIGAAFFIIIRLFLMRSGMGTATA